MVTPKRFVTGNFGTNSHANLKHKIESGLANSDYKSNVKLIQHDTSISKTPIIENNRLKNENRRNRKNRQEGQNHEKSPVCTSNRFLVKHTYTKLEHDSEGPKFTVIKQK